MIDRIKEKIGKLIALAGNNPNVNEAAAAFARAQDLATSYGLSLDEITEPGEPEPEREVEGITRKRVDTWRRALPWKLTIAGAVARANGCRYYYNSATYGPHASEGGITMYGQPSDLAVAEYVYTAIVREVEEMARRAVREYAEDPELDPRFDESPRAFGRSWRMGCADAIALRMRSRRVVVKAKRRELRAAEGAEAERALVRVESAVAYLDRVAEAVEHYKETRLDLGSGQSFTAPRSGDGYSKGRAAGESIGLGHSGKAIEGN